MKLEDLEKFIKKEHQRLIKSYGQIEDSQKRTLARTVKLMEEIGELCDEVLAFNTLQRKQKMHDQNIEKIEEELADVIIVTLLLAENLEVDVWKGLKKKINQIKKRKY